MAEGDDTAVAEKPEEKPAPVPTSAPVTTPGLGELVGVRGLADIDKVTSETAGALREKIERDKETIAAQDRLRNEDLARIHRQYEATRASAERLQPWDAEYQSQKFHTDPLTAFGSLGSVFGILASAFTHAPMENALNASAAAMNAVRANDELGYNRAYKAWQDNMDLAVKRHGMEHTAYQDAISLMETDMRAGEAKLRTSALQFNDKKTLALLDAGLYDEAFKAIESRNKALLESIETRRKIEETGLAAAMYNAHPDSKVTEKEEPDPFKRAARNYRAYADTFGLGDKATPEARATSRYIFDKLSKGETVTGEDLADFHNSYFGWGARPDTAQGAAVKVLQERLDRGEINEQQFLEELNKIPRPGMGGAGGPGRTDLTQPRQRAAYAAAERDRLMKPKEEGGEGLSREQAIERANRAADKLYPPKLTAGQEMKGEEHLGQLKRAEELIDKQLATLKKHRVGLTGVPGVGFRGYERITNVLGSKSTDYVQFRRDVDALKLLALNILLDRQGRPLSAEAGLISNVVAGGSFGDLTQNTVRAMTDLKTWIKKNRGEWEERLRRHGTTQPEEPSPSPTEQKEPSWMRAPKVE